MTKRYYVHQAYHPHPRRLKAALILLLIAIVLVVATVIVRHTYYESLKPVSGNTTSQTIVIPAGTGVTAISNILTSHKLIKSAWAFRLYIYNQDAASVLQAGTYSLNPAMTVDEIVGVLTHGKVVTNLVTILPGQTLQQIRQTFIKAGFAAKDVDDALSPANYQNVPVLVDKPADASLEGFLYPDSYQKNSSTSPQTLVTTALNEMQQQLTPALRDQLAAQGLSTYQGLILASIVEKEVSKPSDRAQVAQVFLARLHQNMMLGSDVTAYFGADLAGQPRSVNYDSPYNTRLHTGLPPTPIGTISASSLAAVANPASTDWLYFVTGDDGTTYFSHTLAEHQAQTQQYCQKLCN